MNIFATSLSTAVCSRNHDDRRLLKLTLEAAQLVAYGRHWLLDKESVYKKGHIHSPICKWSGESEANLSWVSRFLISMNDEVNHRFKKDHGAYTRMKADAQECILLTDGEGIIDFQNSAANASKNISYKEMRPTSLAYRRYLNMRWEIELLEDGYSPRFTNRLPPPWASEYVKANVSLYRRYIEKGKLEVIQLTPQPKTRSQRLKLFKDFPDDYERHFEDRVKYRLKD